MSSSSVIQTPDAFLCPITLAVMHDPVVDKEGNSYERAAIEGWLTSGERTSPVTRAPLRVRDLTPNRALKAIIEQHLNGNSSRATARIETMQHHLLGGVQLALDGGESKSQEQQQQQPQEQNDGVRVSVTAAVSAGGAVRAAGGTKEITVGVSVEAPEGVRRAPVDVVCVVDVSGSMSTEASLKDGDGATEAHGLTLLDVTRHAVRTVIKTLGPQDRLGIVAYSSNARTVCGLTKMDGGGQQRVTAALKGLRPGGQTNLWAGLKTGLEVVRSARSVVGGPRRVASVLLLTDGQPNVEPPRGHIPSLQHYFDANPSLSCGVSTFGFGYNLDSQLLLDLAKAGKGSYSFIPDSSFVGTVFVHATSNLLATAAAHATLSVETVGAGTAITGVVGPQPMLSTSWGAQLPLGGLMFGQSRDVVLKLTVPRSAQPPFVRATVRAAGLESAAEGPAALAAVSTAPSSPYARLEASTLRLEFCTAVDEVTNLGICKEYAKARTAVKELVQRITGSALSRTDPFVKALLSDATGQVTEATSRADWFQKWGAHYLPSLGRAHLLQQCNNFKDPGVQGYGGELFASLRDSADEIFNAIPPPEPSIRRHNAPRIRSMAQYNNRCGGCFHGDARVRMADGELRAVKDVRKGDWVRVPSIVPSIEPPSSANGQGGDKKAQVVCAMQIVCDSGTEELVELPGSGLRLTPWHPVFANGAWEFPAALGCVERVPCEAVYDFVLDDGHVMDIDGVQCVTLGHSFSGKVVGHDYFGSQRVVEDLRAMVGWDDGQVQMHSQTCMVRDAMTTKIVGFRQTAA